MDDISFLNPEFLFLLALLPLLFFYLYRKQSKLRASVMFSNIKELAQKGNISKKILFIPILLRFLALAFLIIAIARPQTESVSQKIYSNYGVDIVMSIDISASMLAKDFKPNRLEALKKVASDFVRERVGDRIGLVIYAAEAYTAAPLTSDKNLLLKTISDIKYDRVIKDGTAIGVGLGTAINRLKNSQTKTKIIILLTDGVNNTGLIDPKSAALIAKDMGLKVYTIAIGTNGFAETPVSINPNGDFNFEMAAVEVDEELLQYIAENTGGKFFRATDNETLGQIYNEINQLEKSKVDEQIYVNKTEKFQLFAIFGFVLLSLEFGLRKTLLKGIL